ncbi:hypothetical protein HZS_2897, partial [Henneguya salminicola]
SHYYLIQLDEHHTTNPSVDIVDSITDGEPVFPIYFRNKCLFTPICVHLISVLLPRYVGKWRCTKNIAGKTRFLGKIFHKNKLSVYVNISLAYSWILYCLKVSILVVMLLIGEDGIRGKVDEAKFGKNKHYQIHPYDPFILGGAERTPERKLFVVKVSGHTEMAFKYYFNTRRKTTILTDCFKSYHNLRGPFQRLTIQLN